MRAEEAPAEARLSRFLSKYDPAIEKEAREVRAKLRSLVPGAVELVYDNYNALVIGYGPSDRASEAVLSMAVMPRWVTLCFLRGVRLADPCRLLRGSGSQVRNIRLHSPADLDQEAIRDLVQQALTLSSPPIDPQRRPQLIIKSVSAKQRPRRPGTAEH